MPAEAKHGPRRGRQHPDSASAAVLTAADGIAVLTLDNPPVNGISAALRRGIVRHLGEVAASTSLRALVIHCAGANFLSGLDARELGVPVEGPDLRATLAALDAFPKPVVVVAHGVALGGGVETMLCADWRVAREGTQIAFQEVRYGLLPGAGGTQRLPRLIGAAPALELMLTGHRIDAGEALAMGLVDEVFAGSVTPREAGLAAARRRLRAGRGKRRVSAMKATLGYPHPVPSARANEAAAEDGEPPPRPARPGAGDYAAPAADPLRALRERAERSAPGLRALARIETCVRAALTGDFDAGLAVEYREHEACEHDPQSAAMLRVFFAERPWRMPPAPIRHQATALTCVVLFGICDDGIALAAACLRAGLAVRLLAEPAGALYEARLRVAAALARPGAAAPAARDGGEALSRLHLATTGATPVTGDVLVLAHAAGTAASTCLARCAQAAPAAPLLALGRRTDVDATAMAGRPRLGLHLPAPAAGSQLAELVAPRDGPAAPLATARAFAHRIGATGVVVRNAPGTVGAFLEAAITGACGPTSLEGGDRDRIWTLLMAFDRSRPIAATDTGSGAGRLPPAAAGLPTRPAAAGSPGEACLLAFVAAGLAALAAGVVASAADLDVICCTGYGFPRHLGGPMHYADVLGTSHLADRFAAVAAAGATGILGEGVPPLLAQVAAAGGSLARLDAPAVRDAPLASDS